MTSNPTKPTPHHVLLVYGNSTNPEIPQASWFRTEDRPAVVTAAQSLKFSVLDVQTDGDGGLLESVHEGVLKSAGRIVVGAVSTAVYKRIEDHVVKTAGALAVKPSNGAEGKQKSVSEQNTNIDDKGQNAKSAPAASDLWDGLRVGSHVAAKYWYDDGHANGWWIAVITAIEGSDFIIRWPDEPKTPSLMIERKHVAVLHPDFDVTREWERKN